MPPYDRKKKLKKIVKKGIDVTDVVGEVHAVQQQHRKNKIWTAKSGREEYLKDKKVKRKSSVPSGQLLWMY